MGEKEIRTFSADLRLINEGGEARIEGYSAVYDVISEDLGGFREVIEPGFFDQALEDDTRALFNHDENYVLGRRRAGTLALNSDPHGLRSVIRPPKTQWAGDLLESMRRGDIDQQSFAFSVRKGGDSWEKRPDGTILRRLKAGGAERLFDVSIVTYPAYPQTSAAVRSMVEAMRGQNNRQDISCPNLPLRGGESAEPEAQAGKGENNQEAEGKAQVRESLRKRRLEIMKMED